MRTTTKLLLAAVISAGLVVAGAGVASARGSRPSPVAATGTVTCRVVGAVSFNPPLQASATGTSDARLHVNLTRCTTSATMHRTTGHVNVDLGSIPSNADNCTAPTSIPGFSGGTVRWTPSSRVASSSVSSAAGGTITVLDSGKAQVAFTDLSVDSGSFTGTGGTATITTRATVAALGAACTGSGLDAISFSGTGTL